jgi:hypothetical protein
MKLNVYTFCKTLTFNEKRKKVALNEIENEVANGKQVLEDR